LVYPISEQTDIPRVPEPEDSLYLAGIEHFNRGEYFEAHEVWEDLWKDCPAADRRFYQALIQAAVAIYHAQRGNRTGAERLAASAKRYTEPYRPSYRGLHVARFWAELDAYLDFILCSGHSGPVVEPPRIDVNDRGHPL
jgi:hypothetical protein